MYKYLITLTILSLFVIGCSEKSNIVSPVDSSTNNNEIVSNPNWILPPAENQALKKDVSVSKTIEGDEDSYLEINTSYYAGWHRKITIDASAEFQRDSFSGKKVVSMSVNDEFGATTFSPSGTWKKPVIFNLKITGLNLWHLDLSNVTFVYMSPNGKYYKAEYDRIYINKWWGIIQVVNAKLPHFSRWGFIN